MAVYRSFLFPGATVHEDHLILDARESHHLIRVFRARAGDSVMVLDGRGRRYHGQIAGADARAVRIAVGSVEPVPAARPPVQLVQAIPKGKAMDLILRMATEIGAASVQPVFTDQSEVQIKGNRLRTKAEKWRLTMIEACKQCGVAHLPELKEPMPLRAYLEASGSDGEPGRRGLGLVASLEPGSQRLLTTLGEARAEAEEGITVAVGPEGDFSEAEYGSLRAAGFRPVRLGANILRAETAAAYILSVIDQGVS